VSEFDKLKDEAEKEIQEHPQQVKEGEEAIEKKLGVDSQDNQADRDNEGSTPQGGQSQGS
jgi:hypothetical protein